MTRQPKIYLFDFWQTLGTSLNEDPITTFYRQLGLGDSKAIPPDDFVTDCLTTDIPDPKRFVERIARTHGAQPTAKTHQLFRQLIASERSNLKIYGDTYPTLQALMRDGMSMGVISNLWPFPVKTIFNRHGLGQYFEHTIFSFETGVRKPNPSIFLDACHRFGVAPDDCLMIGDSVSSDINGAAAIGMPGALILRCGEVSTALPSGTRVIQSLRLLRQQAGSRRKRSL